MRIPDVNLARRPFANTRPVIRVTVALWALGGLLALGNLVLYGRSLAGLDDLEERIAVAEEATREERERVAAAEEALQGLELREQNGLAMFLNERIEARTFPWSQLFDHLAEVLPRDVRLHSLSPRRLDAGASERSASGEGDASERVGLAMIGQAQTDAALLALLDNLFASTWFVEPSLSSEARSPDNTLRFQLSVSYLPSGPAPLPPPLLAAEGAAPAEGDAGGDGAQTEAVAAGTGAPASAVRSGTVIDATRPASPPPAAAVSRSPRGTTPDPSRSARPVPLRPAASRAGGGR